MTDDTLAKRCHGDVALALFTGLTCFLAKFGGWFVDRISKSDLTIVMKCDE